VIYWFVHQKQVVDGLSVAPHNGQEVDVERHALRSSGLLHREASRAKFSQFTSKLVNERRWIVHVTSSQMSRKDKVEDRRIDATGYIGLFYLYFTIFIVLDNRVILFF
jgi:hypothetical protein